MPSNRRKPAAQQHVLDLRRGSRTTPIPSGKTYQRRPKHKGIQGES